MQLQKSAYPDVVPLVTALPVALAFNEALHVAQSMPGWTIGAVDVDAGHIEASQQGPWLRFTDDIVIRIASHEADTPSFRCSPFGGRAEGEGEGIAVPPAAQAVRKRSQHRP